jgi:hypothetical protein
MGITTSPTPARVSAPVSRFSTGERTGKLLLLLDERAAVPRERVLRTEFRAEK